MSKFLILGFLDCSLLLINLIDILKITAKTYPLKHNFSIHTFLLSETYPSSHVTTPSPPSPLSTFLIPKISSRIPLTHPISPRLLHLFPVFSGLAHFSSLFPPFCLPILPSRRPQERFFFICLPVFNGMLAFFLALLNIHEILACAATAPGGGAGAGPNALQNI